MSACSQWLFVPDVTTWTPGTGLVVRLSGRTRSKRDLFGRLRRQLRIPADACRNWDALNDSLRDLTWLEDVPQITLIHDGLPFGEGSTRLRQAYFALLRGLIDDPPDGGPAWTILFPESARAAVERATSAQAQG